MNRNSNFWSIASVVVAVLSFVGFSINWYENRHKSTMLEIKTISEIELTRPLNVERLSSIYWYDSIPVEHLWQSSYVITNTGETTLYGEGFENKNIKGDALPLQLKNCDNLLLIEKVEANTDVILQNMSLNFSQWRPNEYIEIRILTDGHKAPELLINERDIKEGKVMYTQYSPEEKLVTRRLIDHLPLSFSKALWWVVIIFYVIIAFFSMISAVQQYRKAENKTTRTITLVVWIITFIFMLAPLLWMF